MYFLLYLDLESFNGVSRHAFNANVSNQDLVEVHVTIINVHQFEL